MDAITAMRTLHDALICGQAMDKIDELFGEYERAKEGATNKKSRKRAELIGAKLNRRVIEFQKHIDRFANTHHVSPILSSDLPTIHIGFTKSGRWGDVKGNDVVKLQYPEWFQTLDLPAPKQARNVFG